VLGVGVAFQFLQLLRSPPSGWNWWSNDLRPIDRDVRPFYAGIATAAVLSIGLFKAYSRPPVLLYGTMWLIFIAYLTKYLPIAYTACHAALQTVHADLEDAARILGANRLVAFKDVTMPLFGVGLVSAWLLVFLPSLRELSSSILLFTTRSRVVAVVIYTLYEEGLWEAVSALGILLLGLTLLLVAVAQRFLGRRFLQI